MRGNYKVFLLGIFCLMVFPQFTQKLFSQNILKQNMYVEINLNEALDDFFTEQRRPLDVFRVIEKAANDNNVGGIVLNIGSFAGSRTILWELRDELVKFKSGGKKVCAVITSADIDTYCLASAADKIVMDELGTLSLTGYVMGKGYLKAALEKIGVGVRELRYFQFKTAAETFTRDSLSAADRSQFNDYLDDIFNLTRDTLKEARNWSDTQFDTVLNQEFLYSAKEAQSRGLVDFIGGTAAVKAALKEIEGAPVQKFALYGDSVTALMGDNTSYNASNPGGIFNKPPIISVIYADGQTDMKSGMNIIKLSKIIREQADKNRVKAIVIRINSPGGSAQAADYFAEAVRYANSKKPVVVSMGEVAASGGYWVSMNARQIFASHFTLTGSIGVIGSWFYDKGLNDKLGLSTDRLQRGAHADLFTGFIFPYRDLTAQEEERYKSYILDTYNIFVAKVAAGRNMSVEKVESAAQGRVFSGKRAHDAGLIDGVGGLYDAVRAARQLAGIDEGKRVRYEQYPKPKFFDKLLGSLLMATGIARNKSVLSGNLAGKIAPFADMLQDSDIRYRIENNGNVMPILPLDFSF